MNIEEKIREATHWATDLATYGAISGGALWDTLDLGTDWATRRVTYDATTESIAEITSESLNEYF